jgi:hypothetical protein
MKKIFTTLTMAIFALSLFAQGPPQKKHDHPKGQKQEHYKQHGKGSEKVAKNIPAQVAAAFSQDYPKATNAVWTKSKGSFTATFNHGMLNKTSSATYHANGNRMSTNTHMAVKEAPRPVLDEILRRFPRTNRESKMTMSETPYGETLYKIWIKEAGQKKSYSFTENGRMLN